METFIFGVHNMIKMENPLFLLLIFFKITYGVEYPIEKIKTFVVETYYNRNSIDYVARNEEYKKKFNFFEKQTGLTHEQIICSTKVIMCNKEPDSTMWAKSLQDVSIANDDIPAILFFLSFNGYTHAISVMKQILQGVNGKKSWGDFAASTLFKSPTPWYPIAKYIIDSTTTDLRYLLYGVYLPEYVYKTKKSSELKDSLTELICYGLKSEFVPSCLDYADDLLVLIEGSEYRNSIERFYYINKKYKSNEM